MGKHASARVTTPVCRKYRSTDTRNRIFSLLGVISERDSRDQPGLHREPKVMFHPFTPSMYDPQWQETAYPAPFSPSWNSPKPANAVV
jgi:hypothetical protein